MLRTVISFAFRFIILSVLFLIVARAEWRVRRRQQRRQIRSFRGNNPNLDGVFGQGEFGLDARANRRVR